MTKDIETIAKHFVIAALWADAPDEVDAPHYEAAPEVMPAVIEFCRAFVERNRGMYDAAMERASAGYGSHPDAGSPQAAFGHDLFLTVAGHGVGFWDRAELDENGLCEALTEACRACYVETDFEPETGLMHILGPRLGKV